MYKWKSTAEELKEVREKQNIAKKVLFSQGVKLLKEAVKKSENKNEDNFKTPSLYFTLFFCNMPIFLLKGILEKCQSSETDVDYENYFITYLKFAINENVLLARHAKILEDLEKIDDDDDKKDIVAAEGEKLDKTENGAKINWAKLFENIKKLKTNTLSSFSIQCTNNTSFDVEKMTLEHIGSEDIQVLQALIFN